MRLIDVLKGMEMLIEGTDINPSMEITGLTCDSRAVRPGFLFVALPGVKADGRSFIPSAVDKGAICVLAPVGTDGDVAIIEDGNPRRTYAKMAANFYPRQPDIIAAVTGTNGKTSTASFLRQIWDRQGIKAVSLGTIGVHGAGFDEPGGLTTPDPVKLHETLQRIHSAGVAHLAMEASSHGLQQFRLDGVCIKAAGFTNLTRDHLDYHVTMEDYLKAKLRLFSEVVEDGGAAVVNADIPQSQEVIAVAKKRGLRVYTYGRAGTNIRLLEREAQPSGQRLSIMVGDKNFTLNLPLVGRFQAENALCALGLAIALGGKVAPCVSTLERLEGVPGRLQHMGSVNGADVYIDYAHTPDAMENVLTALRPHVKNRLCIMFGCGGDRDAGKRSEMGRIASELADCVMITDDNPRTEDPAKIRKDIMAAAPGAQEVPGRHEAIRAAVKDLNAGDVLVMTGKGTDMGQIVGEYVLPFNEVAEITAAMQEAQA